MPPSSSPKPTRPVPPAPSGADPNAEATDSRVSWSPLVACCLGTFLLLLYTSIVTVALPSVGTGLHAGFASQQWIINAYTLALAGLLLGAGAISDALDSRRVYLAGLVGFTLATLACGLAPSPAWLIGARACQGAAGAAMFASILPLIGLTYTHSRQQATAFAVWGAVAGAASATGTVSGGVLSEYAGWRWMFLGALPLCLGTLVLTARSLPPTVPAPSPASPRTGRPVDWPGIALISVAVTAWTYAVVAGGESGWSAPDSILAWLVTAGAAGAFVLVERASRRPVLPLDLFATPPFVGVLLAAFGYYFATFGALPAIATWMQSRLGVGSSVASLVLVVQLVVFVAVSALIGERLHGLRPSWTLGGGTVLVGVGALTGTATMLLTSEAEWPALLPFLVLSGVGAGVASPVLPAVAIAAVPVHYAGTASAAANAARQLGLALGVAVCGTITHSATTGGVSVALAAGGALAIAAGTMAARLLRRPGQRARTRRNQ